MKLIYYLFVLTCALILIEGKEDSTGIAPVSLNVNNITRGISQGIQIKAKTPDNVLSHSEADRSPGKIAKKSRKGSWYLGYVKAFLMILGMEIGDKTFFIAAILAMTRNKWLVFMGSVSALTVMSIISCVLGVTAPILITREMTVYVAGGLFLFFGVKMIYEGYKNTANDVSDEYGEAAEVVGTSINQDTPVESSDAEAGLVTKSKYRKNEKKCDFQTVLKTFVMVFFAEWGDRSQFSTILLAGTHPISSVLCGSVCGYLIASACAVLGGDFFARWLSPRIISYAGGVLFLLFAIQIIIYKD